MKFNTAYTFKAPDGEINEMPSKTIPGQVMPLKEMLMRYTNGIPLPGDKRLMYDEDVDEDEEPIPVLKDLTDYDEAKSKLAYLQEKMEYAQKMQKDSKKSTAQAGDANREEIAKNEEGNEETAK